MHIAHRPCLPIQPTVTTESSRSQLLSPEMAHALSGGNFFSKVFDNKHVRIASLVRKSYLKTITKFC